MKDILLAMLKAEREPASPIGEVRAKHERLHGVAGLDINDLASFLKGEETFYMEGKYPNHTIKGSFWRSMKSLTKQGLIWVIPKKSPGRHGYLYGLTHNGRAKAEEIWAEVSMFYEKRGKLV